MNARQFELTPNQRALLAPLGEAQCHALYGAARLYDDALDLLTPPMHDRATIASARAFLGSRLGGGWTMVAASALLHWRTSQPFSVCEAFLAAEMDELELAGLI